MKTTTIKGNGKQNVKAINPTQIKETGTYYREMCEKLNLSTKQAECSGLTVQDLESMMETLNQHSYLNSRYIGENFNIY